MMTLSIATPHDSKRIQEITHQTWPDTYGGILSKEQLDFMLDAFYSEAALNHNVVSKGHHFLLAKEDGVVLGFACYEHNYQENNISQIHKIFVSPKAQGPGIGNARMAQLEKLAIETIP